MSEIDERSGEPEILKASSPGREQIQPGMNVVSIEGERIGKVKRVREVDFLIDRPLAHDLWVPFTAVVEAGEHGGAFRRGPTQPSEVVLGVDAQHVEEQGWQHA